MIILSALISDLSWILMWQPVKIWEVKTTKTKYSTSVDYAALWIVIGSYFPNIPEKVKKISHFIFLWVMESENMAK